MSTGDERGRSWLGLLLPAIVAFLILIGLGTWQVQRKAWKEGFDQAAARLEAEKAEGHIPQCK